MRYVLKQKLLSLGGDLTIQDENGRDAFFVDGKAFSIGAKLSFQDMSGHELLFITQKVLSWAPTYELFRGDVQLAVVKKELFTFFHCTFTVDVPGPGDIVAEGDLLDHEYVFRRGDVPVASVSKQRFSWTDTYGVEIHDGEDDVLLLASAVVVDMACHHHRRHG